jgi:lysophospholipase
MSFKHEPEGQFEAFFERWETQLKPFYQSAEIIRRRSRSGPQVHGVFYQGQPAKPFSGECLLLVPGRTEGSLKYTETCFDLVDLGFSVLTFGHLGQGFSERLLSNSQIGHIHNFQNYVQDLDDWYNIILEKNKGRSPHVLAHSMGALVTLNWLQQNRPALRSVAFTSPMLQMKLGSVPETLLWAVIWLRVVLGKGTDFAVNPGELNLTTYGDDLTHCKHRLHWYRKVLQDYPEIQLGYPSNRWMLEALRAQKNTSQFVQSLVTKDFRFLPFLVLEAQDDVVVHQSVFAKLAHNNSSNVEFFQLQNAQHDIFIESDEVRKSAFERLSKHWAKAISNHTTLLKNEKGHSNAS